MRIAPYTPPSSFPNGKCPTCQYNGFGRMMWLNDVARVEDLSNVISICVRCSEKILKTYMYRRINGYAHGDWDEFIIANNFVKPTKIL